MEIELTRFRLIISSAAGVGSVLVTWLFMTFLMDTTPIFNAVVLIWSYLNLIPGFIAAVVAIAATGNPHSGDEKVGLIVLYPLVFVQWAAIAYLVSRPIYNRLNRTTGQNPRARI